VRELSKKKCIVTWDPTGLRQYTAWPSLSASQSAPDHEGIYSPCGIKSPRICPTHQIPEEVILVLRHEYECWYNRNHSASLESRVGCTRIPTQQHKYRFLRKGNGEPSAKPNNGGKNGQGACEPRSPQCCCHWYAPQDQCTKGALREKIGGTVHCTTMAPPPKKATTHASHPDMVCPYTNQRTRPRIRRRECPTVDHGLLISF
jgi:hypothetical protein